MPCHAPSLRQQLRWRGQPAPPAPARAQTCKARLPWTALPCPTPCSPLPCPALPLAPFAPTPDKQEVHALGRHRPLLLLRRAHALRRGHRRGEPTLRRPASGRPAPPRLALPLALAPLAPCPSLFAVCSRWQERLLGKGGGSTVPGRRWLPRHRSGASRPPRLRAGAGRERAREGGEMSCAQAGQHESNVRCGYARLPCFRPLPRARASWRRWRRSWAQRAARPRARSSWR